MHDMTQGPITGHLIKMATPIAIGMFFQTLYILVDLYFVAHRGDVAIAGVGAGGNLQFIVMALTQVLGVGTVTLIAQAVGRKDPSDANLVFNQSLLIALLCAAITLVAGYGCAELYMRALAADAATVAAGVTYLYWLLPGLALQFALIAMGSALRGTGLAMPGMIVQMVTVLLNAVLAPVFIAGWLTERPMGVAGAGLATTISVAAGVVLLTIYFAKLEKYVGFDAAQMRARFDTWKRILVVGLPAGGEFALMFAYMAVIYAIIAHFGAGTQAGFVIGSRVMQAIFLPAMAIAFAVSPVAGQNFGAKLPERVRETFRSAVTMSCVLMFVLTLLCQIAPAWPVGFFVTDHLAHADVIAVGAQFLRIISLNFVAQGIIFSCSGMFQAMGNTVPSLISSATRLLTFAIPGYLLSLRPGFEIRHLWYLSVATVALQALTSLWLLRGQFRRLLRGDPQPAMA